MNLNPKKIIGSLGRRYGGKSFQVVRKVCYNAKDFFVQLAECYYLRKGTYAPWHKDKQFLEKYYPYKKLRVNINLKEKVQLPNQDLLIDKTGSLFKEIKEGFIMMLDGRMFHGGPTDRIRGILTTYREVKKMGMPFYIYWVSPFKLETYLEPATFDWRIKDEDLSYDPRLAFPFIIEDEPNSHSKLRMKAALKPFKKQIHVYSNADNAKGEYRELYNELFRPSAALQLEVEKNLRNLGSSFTAYTFRFMALLGDFKEWSTTVLEEKESKRYMKKVANEFFKLSNDIKDNEKILVTSDSRRFLDYISSIDKRVYVVDGDVKNIDLLQGVYEGAWMKTFIDQQLLMHAKKVTLIRTDGMYQSGFPRFAAEVGNVDYVDHYFK